MASSKLHLFLLLAFSFFLAACGTDVVVVNNLNGTATSNATFLGVVGGVAYFNTTSGIVSTTDFSYNETSTVLTIAGYTVCTSGNGVCNGSGNFTNFDITNGTVTATVDSGETITFTAGSNVAITQSGTTLTISSTGGGGSGTVTSVSQGFGISLTPNPITTTGTVSWDNDTLTEICTPSTEYSVWNGSMFVCRTDSSGGSGTVTSVTLGNGLTGTPNPITTTGSITINAATCTTGNYTYWNGSSFLCSPDTGGSSTDTNISSVTVNGNESYTIQINDTSGQSFNASWNNNLYSAGNGISLSSYSFSTNAATCTAGNYSYWTGTAWLCAPDTGAGGNGTGTVTLVDNGTGLIGGPITTTGSLSLDTTYTNSLYGFTAGSGLNLASLVFSVDYPSLTNTHLHDYSNLTGGVPTDLANFTNSPGYLTSANITPSTTYNFVNTDGYINVTNGTTTTINWNSSKIASSTVTGLLSTNDYNVFNNKGISNLTSVGLLRTGSNAVTVTGSPLTSNGDITISFDNATAAQDGLLRSTDFNTFNNKAGTGNCASGEVVMNTTTGGVQCVTLPTSNTYTASGTLLDLTGTTFSVNEGTLNNNNWCRFVTGTGLVCDVTPVTDTGLTSVGLTVFGSTAVTTTTPLTANGNLNITFQNATAAQDGLLRSTDFNTFNNKAGTGNCASGEVVMNTTTSGVQCVTLPTPSSGGSGNVTSTANGTANYIPSYTNATNIANSPLFVNSTHLYMNGILVYTINSTCITHYAQDGTVAFDACN